MVKIINIILEDQEHMNLVKQKGSKTWKECLKIGVKFENNI